MFVTDVPMNKGLSIMVTIAMHNYQHNILLKNNSQYPYHGNISWGFFDLAMGHETILDGKGSTVFVKVIGESVDLPFVHFI